MVMILRRQRLVGRWVVLKKMAAALFHVAHQVENWAARQMAGDLFPLEVHQKVDDCHQEERTEKALASRQIPSQVLEAFLGRA